MTSIRTWFRAPRVRRGLAASVLALAAGGLVLYRAPASAKSAPPDAALGAPAAAPRDRAKGQSSGAFEARGAHGTFALSHTKVLAGAATRLFAELTVTADPVESAAPARAPLSLAVVLDTSGSMTGEKIEQARASVITLLREMADSDEIALVRYASDSEVIQPLERLGEVREGLIRKVQRLQAAGGTNIPPALSRGLRELEEASSGRVRRVVLVSDGLDSTRAQAEAVARGSGARGVTTSSLGIGLDFDEGYMGGVARAGHGNFAFVESASALAVFLRRELKETAATTIERASARIKLPAGVRFIRATGADATPLSDERTVELAVGSLFAGDQRRVVLELEARPDASDASDVSGARDLDLGDVEGQVSWTRVGGDDARADLPSLTLTATRDEQAVLSGRDGSVLASSTSVLASMRQLEAAEAYASGDGAKAQALIDQNIADIAAAAATAPPAAATALSRQKSEYEGTGQQFRAAAPGSDAGKKAAKASAAKDIGNMARSGF